MGHPFWLSEACENLIMRSALIKHLGIMYPRCVLITLAFLVALCSDAQEPAYGKLQGVVLDKRTGEPLYYALVRRMGEQEAVTTNEDGFFEFKPILAGKHTIIVSYMGYVSDTLCNVNVEPGKVTREHVMLEEQKFDHDFLPGAIYESENGWQRFWRKLAGRPRRYIGPG